MKKKMLISIIMAQTLFLSACGFFPDPVGPNENGQEEVESIDGTANQLDEDEASTIEEHVDTDYYRPVITEDGTYAPSQNRGITRSLNSNVNMRVFETDLMRHSQSYFPTENHFFQEGQYLDSSLVTNWLRREQVPDEDAEDAEEIDEQEQGLNPPFNDTYDPSERNPNYLSSLLEQNYYRQTENGLELAGISVGLALNQIDYYRDEDRTRLQQSIPSDELLAAGEEMADKVISRMRNIEGLEDIPILIGLYEQSTQDDLAAGTYISVGLVENGNTSVSDWESVNENRLVFPLEGMQSAEGNNFANFRSEVEGFFPNVSGVTGLGHYKDEQLINLEVTITTQFYGKGEIIAFTQFLNGAAKDFLPNNVPIQIIVESLNGMESYLYKEFEQEDYEVYIFN